MLVVILQNFVDTWRSNGTTTIFRTAFLAPTLLSKGLGKEVLILAELTVIKIPNTGLIKQLVLIQLFSSSLPEDAISWTYAHTSIDMHRFHSVLFDFASKRAFAVSNPFGLMFSVFDLLLTYEIRPANLQNNSYS